MRRIHRSTIFAGWIGAVRAVLHPPESSKVSDFLYSDACRDKSLTTVLASWTHMRHDFVLHAKMAMTPAGVGGGAELLVEPVPEAFGRIALLSRRLDACGFPGTGTLADLCGVLEEVAWCELGGRDPDDSKTIGHSLWPMVVTDFGEWLLTRFATHSPDDQPSVVIDVHTDSNTLRVLHAATGPLNLLVVPGEEGGRRGWVLSYFEFTEGHLGRLTDAEWRERVDQGHHREARPAWVRSYMYDP